MTIRTMDLSDYEKVYQLWIHTEGMGLKVDAALTALEREGIHKVALVAFEKNALGNIFWEKAGFTIRNDLVYWNKNIHELERIEVH